MREREQAARQGKGRAAAAAQAQIAQRILLGNRLIIYSNFNANSTMATDSTPVTTILALEKAARAVSKTTKNDATGDKDSTTDERCRLLELPAELRNRIWALTMQGGKFSPDLQSFSTSLTNLQMVAPSTSTT